MCVILRIVISITFILFSLSENWSYHHPFSILLRGFFGRNDAKAETPVLWPPHSDAGRDWGQEEKGMTKDEMAGWY